MGVALVRRSIALGLIAAAMTLSLGAITPEQRAMLAAFDQVLTGMAYAAAGLAVFAIVWAGFVLMAEGAEDRQTGKARAAVFLALGGLVLVLSAKIVSRVLITGIVPIP